MRTLYLNGHIYTTAAGDVSAFLVDGQHIVWLGDDSLARDLAADTRVDLNGALVTPAFVDAHLHSTALGRLLDSASASGLPTCSAASDETTANVTTAERRHAQRKALDDAAAHGIACIHEMAGPRSTEADLQQLRDLSNEAPGPEVVVYWSGLHDAKTAARLGAVASGGDLPCDGLNVDDVLEHLHLADEHGLPAAFQAGTAASVRLILAAIEQLRTSAGHAIAGTRLELATIAAVDRDDIERLSSARVTISVRPLITAPAAPVAPVPYKQLASAGIPIILGSSTIDGGVNPWGAVRAVAYPHDPVTAISPRAAFIAHTRGGWRAIGRDDDGSGTLATGSPATFAIWDTAELGVDSVDDRLSRWSTDPRSAVPGLPDLRPDAPAPRCLRTVRDGVVIFDSGVLV